MIKTKQERLREVYEHLRQHFGIHTQIDFAKVLGLTRPAISAAMNGNEAYLTDNLFKRICAAYQGVFNLDYLLTGNGQLLTIQEEVKSEQIEKESNPQQPSSYIDKLIASLDMDGTTIRKRVFENVPVTRNRITTFTGRFFMDGDGEFTQSDFGFVVHTDWDGEDNHDF